MKTNRTRQTRHLGAMIAILLILASTSLAAAAVAHAAPGESAVEREQGEIADLREDVDRSEEEAHWLLIPVTVLIGILALGGGLGVVFSIRDQRRVSQLHELTVTGEVSSQRRSEESYASFLAQSQTTLSLVNDTLKLGKEATDRAAKSMEGKAQRRVDEIEEKAVSLMLEVFNSREFEAVVENDSQRMKLTLVGEELRALEGFLNLQDLELQEYTKFVKALDQFLLDDTAGARESLQLASQTRIAGELRMFTEYWLGYVLTTVGDYDEAIARFEHDELGLSPETSQWFQLERVRLEAKFFRLAKPALQGDRRVDARSPRERYEGARELLEELAGLAEQLAKSDAHKARGHTARELLLILVDVYEWIAYDRTHLDNPLDGNAISRGRELFPDEEDLPLDPNDSLRVAEEREPSMVEDLMRFWALRKAQQLCEAYEGETSGEVTFALAECYFKLADPRAGQFFDSAEKLLPDQLGEHREKRREVALQQSLLICQCRRFTLARTVEKGELEKLALEGKEESREEKSHREDRKRGEERAIRERRGTTQEKINGIRQGEVTIFSHIQRRNLTQAEFRAEVKEIVNQEGLAEDSDGEDR